MSPGALLHHLHWGDRDRDHGTLWAYLAAILFVIFAALSCAIDQSVTMSNLIAPPAGNIGR